MSSTHRPLLVDLRGCFTEEQLSTAALQQLFPDSSSGSDSHPPHPSARREQTAAREEGEGVLQRLGSRRPGSIVQQSSGGSTHQLSSVVQQSSSSGVGSSLMRPLLAFNPNATLRQVSRQPSVRAESVGDTVLQLSGRLRLLAAAHRRPMLLLLHHVDQAAVYHSGRPLRRMLLNVSSRRLCHCLKPLSLLIYHHAMACSTTCHCGCIHSVPELVFPILCTCHQAAYIVILSESTSMIACVFVNLHT